MVDGDRLSSDWNRYISGIEALDRRQTVVGNLTDLGGGATLAEVIAQVNLITAALREE